VNEEIWWEEGSEELAEETLSPFSESDGTAEEVAGTNEDESDAQTTLLTGEIGMMGVGDGSVFGDTKPAGERAVLSKGAWFAIGLIGIPILLSVIWVALLMISEATEVNGWHDEETSVFTKAEGTVEIEGEEYNVYETKFRSMGELGEQGEWEIHIEWGDLQEIPGQWTHCQERSSQKVGPNGDSWWILSCRTETRNESGETNRSIPEDAGFVRWSGKIEGSHPEAFTILSKEPDMPRYAGVWGDENVENGVSDFFGFMAILIWPIGVLGLSVWGFTKGNSALAWGVLSSIVIIPLVFFGLCVLFIFVFFGGGF